MIKCDGIFVQVILRGQYGRLASVDQHGRGLPGLVS